MKETRTIVLEEKDVVEAIKDYIKTHYVVDIVDIRFVTSVRGNYDRGNAEEYVSEVYCEVD